MARRKVIEELMEDIGPTQEEQDLEEFLDAVGDTATTVEILEMLPGNRKRYRTAEPFAAFRENPYEFLRSMLGEGKYLVNFKDSSRKIRRSKILDVGPLPGTATVPGSNPVTPNGAADMHLQFMREQMTMQQNLITAMITSMRGPDIGALLQGIGAITPKANGSDPTAMLTAVATVFTTLRGPEKDEDWLTRAKTIIELAQSLQPGNGGEDSGWSVLKEVGKEVARKIDLSGVVSPTSGKPAIAIPANVATDMAPVQTSVLEEKPKTADGKITPEQQTIEQWLRAALQYLKTKAAMNKDPGVYVEHILDDPEEPQNAALCEAILKGATLEHLFAFDPEIGNNPFYKGWFERLYAGLYSELSQAMDTSGAGRDASDPASDATFGDRGEPAAGDNSTRTTLPKS